MTPYISAADASAWLEAHVVHIDEWTNSPKQAAALEEASDHIDGLMLKGRRYRSDQAREFPRVLGSADESAVPQEVKDACCLEALAILQWGDSWRRRNQEQGVKQVQLGTGAGLQESYGPCSKLLSKKAHELLKFWIAGAVDVI